MYIYIYRSLTTDHSRHTEHLEEHRGHQCSHSPPHFEWAGWSSGSTKMFMHVKGGCNFYVCKSLSSWAQTFILPSSCSLIPVSLAAGFWYTSPQGLSPSPVSGTDSSLTHTCALIPQPIHLGSWHWRKKHCPTQRCPFEAHTSHPPGSQDTLSANWLLQLDLCYFSHIHSNICTDPLI